MGLSAIILAAGQSKRFGENKLFLKYKGSTFFEYTIQIVLSAGFDEVIAVVNHPVLKEIAQNNNLITVENKNAHMGQSTSIKEGVLAANGENDYMFFVSDQPLLTASHVKAILDMRSKHKTNIIAPVYNNKNGNPVIFPNQFRSELLNITGDMGGKLIIEKSTNKTFINFNDEQAQKDIDTLSDYISLIGREIVLGSQKYSNIIIVIGAGDMATGVIQKLHRCGFYVLVLETENPTDIRLTVSFNRAYYEKNVTIEDTTCILVTSLSEIFDCFSEQTVPLIIDPECSFVGVLKPFVVVDATVGSKNLCVTKEMAPVVLALGSDFKDGKDVDTVVETMFNFTRYSG